MHITLTARRDRRAVVRRAHSRLGRQRPAATDGRLLTARTLLRSRMRVDEVTGGGDLAQRAAARRGRWVPQSHACSVWTICRGTIPNGQVQKWGMAVGCGSDRGRVLERTPPQALRRDEEPVGHHPRSQRIAPRPGGAPSCRCRLRSCTAGRHGCPGHGGGLHRLCAVPGAGRGDVVERGSEVERVLRCLFGPLAGWEGRGRQSCPRPTPYREMPGGASTAWFAADHPCDTRLRNAAETSRGAPATAEMGSEGGMGRRAILAAPLLLSGTVVIGCSPLARAEDAVDAMPEATSSMATEVAEPAVEVPKVSAVDRSKVGQG
eukprot:189838-Chlamydomonas_euryale.AAC.1